MKVVGINGSSRKDGNTAILIKTIFEKLHENGIETELIELPDVTIAPCKMCEGGKCLACMEKGACVFTHDDFHIIFEKIKEADGLILGSKRKPGAAVSAVRRAGGMTTVDTLNHFMLFREMIIVGSTYWNMVYGKNVGDVLNDSEGMANMRNIGENMAWLLKNLHAEQKKER